MKPAQSLLFLISVILFLATISFILNFQDLNLFNIYKIKSINFAEIFKPDTAKNINISEIISQNDENLSKNTEIKLSKDTSTTILKTDTANVKLKSTALKVENLKTKIYKLEFANKNKSHLYSFFKNILYSKKTVHILHIGDSQLEGDRITSLVRNKFQKKFGGSGVGLVPAKRLVKAFSLNQTSSNNWIRYNVENTKNKNIISRSSIMGGFCRYAKFYNDTLNDTTVYSATVTIEKSPASYYLDGVYKKIKIFFGNNNKPFFIELYDGDKLLNFKSELSSKSLKIYEYSFSKTPKKLIIKFTGRDSPDIYGISLEGNSGVVFDNIAIRGSSGTFFSKINQSVTKAILKSLNTKMLILEFGGNSMPYIKNKKAADNYGKWFYSQLLNLKSKVSGIPIIVIGPADMSIKKDGKYITYPNHKFVREAMRKACFSANCIYWDMFEAMGGENSMPQWVSADPQLASTDYTHFTSKGAKIIANMFYNSLMFEYNDYLKTIKKKW